MIARLILCGTALAFAAPAAAQDAFAAPPVAEEALGTIAGRADTSLVARSNQTSVVAENSVGDGVTTGDVRIDAQAFQNLQGLSLLNVNTGNNVSMNSAMNVTISIAPPGL
jgi:hypothetical protein